MQTNPIKNLLNSLSFRSLSQRLSRRVSGLFAQFLTLPSNDLLRDAVYRRLWTSILISSFGQQVTILALPLTAAVLLHATPTQMGLLTMMELLPFALLSLPSGVWLDRVRKLPVYIIGELLIAFVLASVPAVWALGWLTMGYLYAIGFALGCGFVIVGTAAQIVLTQVVPRARLVEAHAKNALASSGAEVAGPGLAGLLIKLVGAPFALLADACMLGAAVLFALAFGTLRIDVLAAAAVAGATGPLWYSGRNWDSGRTGGFTDSLGSSLSSSVSSASTAPGKSSGSSGGGSSGGGGGGGGGSGW